MKSFVLRARKVSSDPERLLQQVDSEAHAEILAHVLMNALYRSSALRTDTDAYLVLEAGADFPKTVRCSGAEGVSFPGFSERSILGTLAEALRLGRGLFKGEERPLAPGISLLGYGFEQVVKNLGDQGRPIFLLDQDGAFLGDHLSIPDPVFLLSDHLAMPRKTVAGLERLGVKPVNIGPELLFASQCVSVVHYLYASAGSVDS